MTDRDTFAAAAFPCCHEEIFGEGKLTGYPADWRDQIVRQAYAYADAMLRERGRAVSDNCVTGNQREMECPVTEPLPKEKRAEVSSTLTDAEREAISWAAEIACADDSDDFALWNAGIMQRLLKRLGGER